MNLNRTFHPFLLLLYSVEALDVLFCDGVYQLQDRFCGLKNIVKMIILIIGYVSLMMSFSMFVVMNWSQKTHVHICNTLILED